MHKRTRLEKVVGMYVAREDACRAAVRAAVTPAYAPALWSLSLIATTMYQTTQFGCDIIYVVGFSTICRTLDSLIKDNVYS